MSISAKYREKITPDSEKTAFAPETVKKMAQNLFAEERSKTQLEGWFKLWESRLEVSDQQSDFPPALKAAYGLRKGIENLSLELSENQIFAGSQRDAFARSYALINPEFKVESFSGYCDPTAVFSDIHPSKNLSKERIQSVKEQVEKSPFTQKLKAVYQNYEKETKEVAFFVEQVTGHLIPDFRLALKKGLCGLLEEVKQQKLLAVDPETTYQYEAMTLSLETALLLAQGYAKLAKEQKLTAQAHRKIQLERMIHALTEGIQYGANDLYQGIQIYLILWQVMCLEQAPNPFAFSVGNADRIFEPYRIKENLTREETAALFCHFLVFFNVGDRSWAISQNILLGGKDYQGCDQTSLSTLALLDAFYSMNLPQPILSIKLHKNTPDQLYEELGRFFFTPGLLTPSLFNDDALFPLLESRGVSQKDCQDYAVAGCQEPLIMGKDNGNTTNSWLNLAKILELTIHQGYSSLTGEWVGASDVVLQSPQEKVCKNLRQLFLDNCRYFAKRMEAAANEATAALSLLPIPFLSLFMGGLQSGVDLRDIRKQASPYNGSGCLIHGLSVVSDSFVAIDYLLQSAPEMIQDLPKALKANFQGFTELRNILLAAPKFGNNQKLPDEEALWLAREISTLVSSLRNNWSQPFRPDWSTPSTHLLYGYQTGATPDGREARSMLNYGIDPLLGEAQNGLGFRVLSARKLPYESFIGGYASHLGLDPKYFPAKENSQKGLEFKSRVIQPLFYQAEESAKMSPFYLYCNVTTADTLRKVRQKPEKYAPSGVYIMRIHGTFVNFLDLSPSIQEDIILRLDPASTAL